MTTPAQIGGAGMGAGVFGTILSAFGAYNSGKAQAKQYDYLAGVAKARAAIDMQNRDYALQTGETEAQNYGMRARFQAGRILATQGSSGIDVGSDSSVRVRQGQQLIANRDMGQIRNNAARIAYGHEVEAAFDTAQAGAMTAAAKNVRWATPINVASSLLSGAGSVASKWYQGQQVGIYGKTKQEDDSEYTPAEGVGEYP